MKISHVPLRLATGAFFLNSGLSKIEAADEVAEDPNDRRSVRFSAVGAVKRTDLG